MAVTAAGRLNATMFGTVATAGPRETVSVTPEPGGTCVPASGACEMTRPAAIVASLTSVIVGASPAPATSLDADSLGLPTTLGTVTASGPADTEITTEEPCATVVPPAGSWLMITLGATVELLSVLIVSCT